MSANRILLIENPATLSVRLGRLRIERNGLDEVFILPSDISVLVLHHSTIKLTNAVLQVLTAAGAMLLVTDEKHLPKGLLLPWKAQDRVAIRLRQQIHLDNEVDQRSLLWREIVQCRLLTQAVNLRFFSLNGSIRLERMSQSVNLGDSSNLEAQGAKHYWKHILPEGSRREKQGAIDPVNVRLNYGYAVLRAIIARELAAHGLQPALGIGHASSENAFNLADDILELFRFCVERRVMQMDFEQEFDGEVRVQLLSVIEDEVKMPSGSFRLPFAIAETVNSFLRILENREKNLVTPLG